MIESEAIREKLSRTSTRPGVYLLKDAKGKTLYVGKAKMLRNRLRSHFNPGKDEDRRHYLMMSHVTDFETIVTDSEVEALILEANFVKQHKPRYNVNLKDDKSYPYIRVTSEPYPRIFVTRKLIRDGSRYFGPYTDVQTLRNLMSAIRRMFTIRTCKLQIDESSIAGKKHRLCLMYHIGRCLGPCEGLISEADYSPSVEQAVDFIQGRNTRLVKTLTDQMQQYAEKQMFEEAARLRDQIRFVENFQRRQKMVDDSKKDRDIFSFAASAGGSEAVGLVFNVRDGKIINRQHYQLDGVENKSENEILNSFLEQYYVRTEFVPGEVLLPLALDDLDQIREWLTTKRGQKTEVLVPQRGDKARLMAMCRQNAELLLNELIQQRQQSSPKISGMVEALQKDLGLETPPIRIEAFDNSNIQGSDPVASLVVFENGKPKKSDYRKYKIKTVQGIDDFASMAEVVERRITRLLREGSDLPDLILVDGGKGQLSAAYEVLKKFELEDQPIIGLAKRLEEIFRPGLSDAQTLPKSSPSLRLLQQLRDEAHRFAITFHRSLRQKRAKKSELDDIPGVGEKRRKALLKTFGSVKGIKSASLEKIAGVEGMNKKIAKAVKEALSKSK